MEETTTVAPTNPGVEASTQPANDGQQAAAQPQQPVTQSQPAQANDEYAAWLVSKQLDPTAADAFEKVARMAYNSEKLMTKATQEASELRKSLAPQTTPQAGVDASMQEFIQEYRLEKRINSFRNSHNDWQQYEPSMVELLDQQVSTPYGVFTRSELVNEGILSLDDVYVMAKGSAPVDTQQIKSQTRQEVLQTLANTQRAGGGTAHASDSTPQSSKSDPIMEAIRRSRG